MVQGIFKAQLQYRLSANFRTFHSGKTFFVKKINFFNQNLELKIIWKNTEEVGFGISKTSDGNFYAVAYYYPAGNVLGEFSKNILKPLYE